MCLRFKSDLSKKDRYVLFTLQSLFMRSTGGGEDSLNGIETRTIADACDLSIYCARYSLLKLAKASYVVLCTDENKGKSNFWALNTLGN